MADYFVMAGLPDKRKPLIDLSSDSSVKSSHKQDPIVEVTIINKGLGEVPPPGFCCLELTPSGFPADLNHGSIRAPEIYLCIRRGRDLPPLTDIGSVSESCL